MIINSTPSKPTLSQQKRMSGNDEGRTHSLSANNVSQPSKDKLADQSSDWGSNFDAKVLVLAEFLIMAIDVSQHCRCDIDGEDIVAVRKLRQPLSREGAVATYASVKKPTPATRQTLTWNHLIEEKY